MASPNSNRDLKGELKVRQGYVYDVKMRGYDTSYWKTLTGTPSVASNKLRLNAEECASYRQHLYGTFTFAINVPTTPSAGEAKKWGLLNPACPTLGSIYFEIVGAVFRVISRDNDGTAETTVATWDGEAAETLFKIEWERDNIVFSLGGTVLACHKTRVGSVPLALYLINEDADNTDTGYIEVRDTALVI